MMKPNKHVILSSVKKLLTLVFAVVLTFSSFGLNKVNAESSNGRVIDVGTTLPGDYDFQNLTLIDRDGLKTYAGSYSSMTEEDGTPMGLGTIYTAKYSVNYYGIPLTVETSATLLTDLPSRSYSDPKKYANVYIEGTEPKETWEIDKRGLLSVAWEGVSDARTRWDIKIYDNDNVSYLKYFLFGFIDPDESNYQFDSAGRTVFFTDAEAGDGSSYTAASFYNFVNSPTEGGFFRSKSETHAFKDAVFVVDMLQKDSDAKVFSFTSITKSGGSMFIPYLYSLGYNITYDLNDSTTYPAIIEDGNPVEYGESPRAVKIVNNPTRTGFDFLGWKEVYPDGTESESYIDPENAIPANSKGDKKFKAYWAEHHYDVIYHDNVPAGTPNIEEGRTASGSTDPQLGNAFGTEYTMTKNGFVLEGYTFAGWSRESGVQTKEFDDEATYKDLTVVNEGVVDLYAQWSPIEYTVRYDSNKPDGAPDPVGEMGDDEHRQYDVGYLLTQNAFSIDSYDFIGWSTTSGVQPKEFDDEAPYKNLVKENGGIVTLFAQWQRWTYTIKYEANGGTGEMPDQIFHNEDTEMRSKENAFTRDGYNFRGFDYEYKGVKYHLDTTDDFVVKLKALGHFGEITLVAQWEKKSSHSPVQYDDDDDNGRVYVYYQIPVTGIE